MRPIVQLNNSFGGATVLPAVPRARSNYGQAWYNQTIRDIFGIVKLEYDVTENLMLYGSAGARDTAERGLNQGVQVLNATNPPPTDTVLCQPTTIAPCAAFVKGSNQPPTQQNATTHCGPNLNR